MAKEWGCLNGVNVMGQIVKIHDGDSVHVLAPVGEAGGSYIIKCRLNGIDTPELKSNKTAKIALENIVAETDGKVFCNFGKKEKYGRILLTLYGNPTKPSINQQMIQLGEAKEYHGGKKEAFEP
jgi:endonuclease YncB( thermonuclease family)